MTQTLKPSASERYVSYEDFLDMQEGDTLLEWIEGEVITLVVDARHTQIGRFLISVMSVFVDAKRCGMLLYEPFQMKTGPNLPGRSPDLFFLSNASLQRLKRNFVDGPADLVIEIVSDDSARRDRVTKYREYELGGVREYWIIDPTKGEALFYVRGADGGFHSVDIGDDGVYSSTVLSGFRLPVAWLLQEPLPSLVDALHQVGALEAI